MGCPDRPEQNLEEISRRNAPGKFSGRRPHGGGRRQHCVRRMAARRHAKRGISLPPCAKDDAQIACVADSHGATLARRFWPLAAHHWRNRLRKTAATGRATSATSERSRTRTCAWLRPVSRGNRHFKRAGDRGRVRLISKGIETAPAVRHAPSLTHGPNSPTITHIIGALCAASYKGNKVAPWLTAIAFGLVRARVRAVLGWVTSWEVLVRQASDVAQLDLVGRVGCKSVMPDLNGSGQPTVNSDLGRSTQIRDRQLRSGIVNSQLRSGQSTVKSDLDSQQSTQIWTANSRLRSVQSTVDSDLDSEQSTQFWTVNSQPSSGLVNSDMDWSTQLWTDQLRFQDVNSYLVMQIQIWRCKLRLAT
ncbi:testis-expressed sequence 2 protein [Dorcoceras hygrometricum]|uniref:Testis-expressed sequence 2 protein n=1 Tax=Dorcoceras hygrometricum TaxID=472368 RepID=A0A2Z7ARS0_9LAMI|nr:testis-expressed sequence 2 protein [Dorcoceras hygrometricum]